MTRLIRKFDVLCEEQQKALMKVAFASSDRIHVNQHFGSARGFVIYGVGPDDRQLLNLSEFDELAYNDDSGKLNVKLGLLEGCIAVYCRACGASAIRRLLAKGIQPVKVTEGALIADLIQDLQQELLQGPSSWLAKAIAKNTIRPSRMNKQYGENQ